MKSFFLKFNILLFMLVFFTNFSADVARAEEPTSYKEKNASIIVYLHSGQYKKIKQILAKHADDVDNNIPLSLLHALLDALYWKVDNVKASENLKAQKMLAFLKYLISEYHVRIIEGIEAEDRTLLHGTFWSERNIAEAIIASFPVNYLLEVDTSRVGLFYNFVWNTTPEIYQTGLQRIDLTNENYASKILLGNLSDCMSDKSFVDSSFESARPDLEACLEKLRILVRDDRLNEEVLARSFKDESYCEQLKATYQDSVLGVDADNFCSDLNKFLQSIPADISRVVNDRISKYEAKKGK